MSDAKLEAALDLTRRLPPVDIEDNLFYLLDLAPDLTESLLSTVDQPLKVQTDEKAGKDYLLCDYNRDGDSFRSPWSNKYQPEVENPAMPSDKLRDMEVLGNKVFDRYRDMYFGQGSISSVYFWDIGGDSDTGGWACCVLFFKEGESGVWNSIHVVEVTDKSAKTPGQYEYKLTTTVMLTLKAPGLGKNGSLSGSVTRQETREHMNPKDDTQIHLAHMGRMIENLEGSLRSAVDVVYFGKTQEVLSYIRELQGTKEMREREAAQRKVISEMRKAAS